MPKRGKYKKDKTQPSVALMLNLAPSAKGANPIESKDNEKELKSQNSKDSKKKRNKKRRRETGDSTEDSP